MTIATALLLASTLQPVLATHFLDRPGGRIAYDDTGVDTGGDTGPDTGGNAGGEGALVVCVPGMGDVRAQYRYLRPVLLAQGFRVVTMDLRGLGESTAKWESYAASDVGADVVALVRALGARRVYVVGNSMAAAAAVWAAAELPEVVQGIVLIGPFVRDMPTSFLQSVGMKLAFLRPWGPAAWGSVYRSLYAHAVPQDFEPYRAHLKANLAERGRLEALRKMFAASKADCEARLSKVKAPALVVMGSEDSDFPSPEKEAQRVAASLRGTVALIAGTGHYPHVEKAELTGNAIAHFLVGVRDKGQ